MSLWNVSSASGSLIVATGRHGHFVWLVFDTDQKFFDFKISFFVEFVSSSSRLLIVSRVVHVLNGDSPFIQNQKILILKSNFSFECINASRSLIVARDRHGHFEWLFC